jgi:hypothetical protein
MNLQFVARMSDRQALVVMLDNGAMVIVDNMPITSICACASNNHCHLLPTLLQEIKVKKAAPFQTGAMRKGYCCAAEDRLFIATIDSTKVLLAAHVLITSPDRTAIISTSPFSTSDVVDIAIMGGGSCRHESSSQVVLCLVLQRDGCMSLFDLSGETVLHTLRISVNSGSLLSATSIFHTSPTDIGTIRAEL